MQRRLCRRYQQPLQRHGDHRISERSSPDRDLQFEWNVCKHHGRNATHASGHKFADALRRPKVELPHEQHRTGELHPRTGLLEPGEGRPGRRSIGSRCYPLCHHESTILLLHFDTRRLHWVQALGLEGVHHERPKHQPEKRNASSRIRSTFRRTAVRLVLIQLVACGYSAPMNSSSGSTTVNGTVSSGRFDIGEQRRRRIDQRNRREPDRTARHELAPSLWRSEIEFHDERIGASELHLWDVLFDPRVGESALSRVRRMFLALLGVRCTDRLGRKLWLSPLRLDD